ncbi:S-layer homology domain-containing protein [Cohnella zeiphila]|uniref:S-layer homology domain-containing protein n=1 Tax=Cohnella zeiphila TaxID=2761120 RepID=A0A7X0VYE6_9BACL|nr:S-layer homology domain-containing protein [Cohnella zeiphila]MBB6734946.1 S-layer homology domain-containing protein [Cohnella zeiphila]
MRRFHRMLALLLVLTLGAGSLFASSASVKAAPDVPTTSIPIPNGDFETGSGSFDVPGNEVGSWGAAKSSYGTPIYQTADPVRHGQPHGGLQFAAIPAGMAVKASIQQTVSGLEEDTNYVLSGYIRNEASSTRFTVGVRYFDASHPDLADGYKVVSNSQTWTRFELPFKTGDGQTEVGIQAVNNSDGGFGYIDDLELVKVSAARAALSAKVLESSALREADYTPASWSVLADALSTASALLADPASSDESLTDALDALQTAMDGLTVPPPIEQYVSPGHTTYYVSMSDGDDNNDGLSPETPWQTIAKVNAATFAPGDRLLFKSGDVWSGDILRLRGSGAAGDPIVAGSYGDADAKPYINAQGKTMTISHIGSHDGVRWNTTSPIQEELSTTIYMENEQYWEITGLEISNSADSLPAAGLRNGILIRNDNAGTLNHIYIEDCYIHDVLGDKATKSYWGNAGILYTVEFRDPARALEVTGNADTKSNFNDILIQGNYVRNVNRQGITLNSRQNLRPEVDNQNTKYWGSEGISDWYPSTGVVIRENYLENIGGDGILPQVTIGAITEYNTVNGFNRRSGGASAGIWAWNADDSLFQFNEAFGGYTTQDGQGYDVDYAQTGTIFQYNYSHDNDGGFMLICSPAQDGAIVNGRPVVMKTNDAIIRYNVSQNEKNRIYMFSGYSDGTLIYNNTHYQAPSTGSVSPISFWAWGGSYPTSVSFFNNIFQLENPTANWGLRDDNAGVEMQNIAFDYNIVYGTHGTNEPTDKGEHNVTDKDPMLAAPGTGMTMASLEAGYQAPDLDGYKLMAGSPAIGVGKTIEFGANTIVETRHRVLSVDPNAAPVQVPEPKASNDNNAFYASSRLPDAVRGGSDYFGNTVAFAAAPNIGAYGGPGLSSGDNENGGGSDNGSGSGGSDNGGSGSSDNSGGNGVSDNGGGSGSSDNGSGSGGSDNGGSSGGSDNGGGSGSSDNGGGSGSSDNGSGSGGSDNGGSDNGGGSGGNPGTVVTSNPGTSVGTEPSNGPGTETETGATFHDVGDYAWAKDAIVALAAKGIIKGTGNGSFSPEKNVTRADFVLLLVRAFGLEEDANAAAGDGAGFADVRPGDYYYEALTAAKRLRLIQGSSGNRFDPKAEITRQDMMVLLERVLRFAGKLPAADAEDSLDGFKDAGQVSAYAEASVRTLMQAGIIQGNGGMLNPLGKATRAEAAVSLYKALTEL